MNVRIIPALQSKKQNYINEINDARNQKIDAVFENVKTVDDTISARIISRCQELKKSNTYITSMSNNIIG